MRLSGYGTPEAVNGPHRRGRQGPPGPAARARRPRGALAFMFSPDIPSVPPPHGRTRRRLAASAAPPALPPVGGPAPAAPAGAATASKQAVAYVVNQNTNDVAVFDTATDTITA